MRSRTGAVFLVVFLATSVVGQDPLERIESFQVESAAIQTPISFGFEITLLGSEGPDQVVDATRILGRRVSSDGNVRVDMMRENSNAEDSTVLFQHILHGADGKKTLVVRIGDGFQVLSVGKQEPAPIALSLIDPWKMVIASYKELGTTRATDPIGNIRQNFRTFGSGETGKDGMQRLIHKTRPSAIAFACQKDEPWLISRIIYQANIEQSKTRQAYTPKFEDDREFKDWETIVDCKIEWKEVDNMEVMWVPKAIFGNYESFSASDPNAARMYEIRFFGYRFGKEAISDNAFDAESMTKVRLTHDFVIEELENALIKEFPQSSRKVRDK